jgi:proteic killer suppression protein
VIISFADKETEKIFKSEVSRKLPIPIQKIARRKIVYLDEAEDLNDLSAPPGNRLEKLYGNRSGQYSIREQKWKKDFQLFTPEKCFWRIS